MVVGGGGKGKRRMMKVKGGGRSGFARDGVLGFFLATLCRLEETVQ